jgi:hypothetical protein
MDGTPNPVLDDYKSFYIEGMYKNLSLIIKHDTPHKSY